MDDRLQICRASSLAEIREQLDQVLTQHADLLPPDPAAPILLKPNLNANMNALTGNTTDLRILAALLGLLKDRGHTNLQVGEGTNSGFYRNNISVITRLRVDALCAHFGAQAYDFNQAAPVDVPFESGIVAQAARPAAQAALFINLPKLKTHFEMTMSVCLKNLMGCLIGQENKKKTHQSLAKNIVNLNQALKPHLHIVDALICMEGLGPTRGTPLRLDTLIAGRDPYLIDLVCAGIAGFDHASIPTLAEAQRRGLLTPAHHQAAARLTPRLLDRPFAPPKANAFASFIHHPQRQKYFLAVRNTPLFTYLAGTKWFGHLLFKSGLRQDVFCQDEMDCQGLGLDKSRCDGCGLCARYCPLGLDLPGQLPARPADCLGCLYCYGVCPPKAIEFIGQPGFFAEQERQYDALIRALHKEEV